MIVLPADIVWCVWPCMCLAGRGPSSVLVSCGIVSGDGRVDASLEAPVLAWLAFIAVLLRRLKPDLVLLGTGLGPQKTCPLISCRDML